LRVGVQNASQYNFDCRACAGPYKSYCLSSDLKADGFVTVEEASTMPMER